jgi:hypothetical protein
MSMFDVTTFATATLVKSTQLTHAGTAEIANGIRAVRLSLGTWRCWPSSRSLLPWTMKAASTCGASQMDIAR